MEESKPILSIAQLKEGTASNEPDGKQQWEPEKLRNMLRHIAKQKLDSVNEEFMLSELKKESKYSMASIKRAHAEITAELNDDQPAEELDIECLFTDKEKAAAARLADQPNLFDTFPINLDLVDYVTTPIRARSMLLILGLTQIKKVFYVCFYGDTSDGKTEAAEKELRFIDYEGALGIVIKRLDVSPQWLKYAGGDKGTGLTNKILFFDEVNPTKPGEDDTRQSMMRQFDSENSDYAEYAIVDKNAAGRNSERILRLKKPTQFFMTSITAPHDWDPQNRNRYIFLEFSHSPDSVVEVQQRIAEPWSTAEDQKVIFKSWNYFLLKHAGRLDPHDPSAFYAVEINFLKDLISRDDNACGSDIRRFKLLKSFISASALLHAGHRKMRLDEQGRKILIADYQDLLNVKLCFEQMVPRVTQPAGKAFLETFKKIAAYLFLKKEAQSKYDLKLPCGLSEAALDRHFKPLVNVGLLETESRAGDRKAYYKPGQVFNAAVTKALNDCGKPEADNAVLEIVVDSVIRQLESTNLISSVAPSTSVAAPPTEVNPLSGKDLEQLRCSLGGYEKEEISFDPSLALGDRSYDPALDASKIL